MNRFHCVWLMWNFLLWSCWTFAVQNKSQSGLVCWVYGVVRADSDGLLTWIKTFDDITWQMLVLRVSIHTKTLPFIVPTFTRNFYLSLMLHLLLLHRCIKLQTNNSVKYWPARDWITDFYCTRFWGHIFWEVFPMCPGNEHVGIRCLLLSKLIIIGTSVLSATIAGKCECGNNESVATVRNTRRKVCSVVVWRFMSYIII